jgi:hypothetical protein
VGRIKLLQRYGLKVSKKMSRVKTWDDIVSNLQKSIDACKDENGNENTEKFACLKNQMLKHLDKVEEDEKANGSFTKQYRIFNYAKWDDEVFNNVQSFNQNHNVYPNILLANKKTYAKIDGAVKKYGTEKLFYSGGEDEMPDFDGLSDFVSDEFTLDFCLDGEMRTNYYKLVYDSAPTFDGEYIEDEKSRVNICNLRKTRYRYKLAA